jgi:hypothetical protein
LKSLHVPQFSIQSLMYLIGAIACTLALMRWLGAPVTIIIAIFPLSVIVERLFGTMPPTPHAQPSLAGLSANLMVLIACASLCTAAAWCSCASGMPTVLSPLPLLVLIPLFLAPDPVYAVFWRFVAPIPFGTFLLMSSYQLRVQGEAPLPTRFSFLLGLATAFSVFHFAMFWADGVRFQGVYFTLAVAVINLAFLIVLWNWWRAIRRKASKAPALGFATLLHCWLFWFAFPCLIELP